MMRGGYGAYNSMYNGPYSRGYGGYSNYNSYKYNSGYGYGVNDNQVYGDAWVPGSGARVWGATGTVPTY